MVTREASLVKADELEEAGDPRAELIRAQLEGRDDGPLLAQHWAAWLGALDPKQVLCRWSWGALTEVCVRAAPVGWTAGDLVALPTASELERLALGERVSAAGVARAPGLRELVCFGPLETKTVPAQTLTLALGAETNPADLATLAAPRLSALHTRCAATQEAALCRAVARAPWFAGLTQWTHRVASPEGVAPLLELASLRATGGAGLVLRCPRDVLEAVVEPVRRALPHAVVVVLPAPVPARDPEDRHGPVELSVTPHAAPMHFRALAPSTSQSSVGSQSDDPVVTTVGSGVPADGHRFSTCGWCASPDTRVIWSTTWSLYSHFETTRYRQWEYECRACGLFNFMAETRTS